MSMSKAEGALISPDYIHAEIGMRVFTMGIGGLMYQATIGGQRYGFRPVTR